MGPEVRECSGAARPGRLGAQELEQRRFGAIEEAVEQFAQGGAAHGIAGGSGRIDEGAADFAAGQLALAHQAVQHGHDGGVGQRARLRDNLLHGPDIAFLQRPERLRQASSSGGGTSRAVFGISILPWGGRQPACNSLSAMQTNCARDTAGEPGCGGRR